MIAAALALFTVGTYGLGVSAGERNSHRELAQSASYLRESAELLDRSEEMIEYVAKNWPCRDSLIARYNSSP
jgi:hypothetical protein